MHRRDGGGSGRQGGFGGGRQGGFGGGGQGGFGGPPFGPRRVGVPLIPSQYNAGIGGTGLGSSLLSSLGLGGTGLGSSVLGGTGTSGLGSLSPILTSLVAGGLGYFVGNRTGQNAQQDHSAQPLPTTQPTQAVQPVQEPSQSYAYTGATTNLSQTPTQQATAASAGSDSLSKLQLLGELHQSGVLTDQEFEQQKQRLLNS